MSEERTEERTLPELIGLGIDLLDREPEVYLQIGDETYLRLRLSNRRGGELSVEPITSEAYTTAIRKISENERSQPESTAYGTIHR